MLVGCFGCKQHFNTDDGGFKCATCGKTFCEECMPHNRTSFGGEFHVCNPCAEDPVDASTVLSTLKTFEAKMYLWFRRQNIGQQEMLEWEERQMREVTERIQNEVTFVLEVLNR